MGHKAEWMGYPMRLDSSYGVVSNMHAWLWHYCEFEHTITLTLGPMPLGKSMNSPILLYDMDFRFIPSDPVCFDKLSHCD